MRKQARELINLLKNGASYDDPDVSSLCDEIQNELDEFNDAIVWRDANDSNSFHCGVKNKGKSVWWLSIFSDAFSDMFDNECYQWFLALKQGGAPVALPLYFDPD